MSRISLLSAFLILFLANCKKPEYQKQELLVTGTREPYIMLDGKWRFSMNPPADFYSPGLSDEGWSEIMVPGECAMQGFSIRHNKPFAYRRLAEIPADYAGKRIVIRFENVYSYARVWVNGKYIREHKGGFTSWDCDITGAVKAGENALIAVEVTDYDNDLSYASGYAKHPVGGILRSVTLHAFPKNFPESITVTTSLDQRYRDADLGIRIIRGIDPECWVGFRLYDLNGNQVRLNDRRYRLRADTSLFTFKIQNPFKWDAENPNIYTLIVEVFNNSILTASYKTDLGFREVRTDGNRLLVNGRPVKLRGACRHDIHPLLGRVSTPYYDSLDVVLAKEANINFIRTSHYPPSASFLKFCDMYGIYVEVEAPACFIDTHRNRFYKELKQSGEEFLSQQEEQVREMVGRHINHPSVIIWSLGNESIYNEGFRRGYEYIKSADRTRPVIFSYPGTVPDSVRCYDFLSLHYPSWRGDISNQYGKKSDGFNAGLIPVIFDEWAHVACYNKPELLEDMNVRNFWGISLDSMWSNLFESTGTGGAIWGMIDEVFMLPDTLSGYGEWWGIQEESNGVRMYEGPAVGYGEWGIIDIWRRRKPEFWNTKKAYSPVRIPIDAITAFKPGMPLRIPVYNRFSHTNLKDIKAVVRYRGKNLLDIMPNVDPMQKGDIQLPPSAWREGEMLNIRFMTRDSMLIDEYNLRFGVRKNEQSDQPQGKINVTQEKKGTITVALEDTRMEISTSDGSIRNIIHRNDTLVKSGPRFHLRYAEKEHWSVEKYSDMPGKFIAEDVSWRSDTTQFEISSSGKYASAKIRFSIRIEAGGLVNVSFAADALPAGKKVEELGLSFDLGDSYKSLAWTMDSYWNAYPENHPGSFIGIAMLDEYNRNHYRERPQERWELDNSSFYYNGLRPDSTTLTWLAGGMKENVYTYSLKTADNKGLSVISGGDHACRIRRNSDGYSLIINSLWDYGSLAWGNYMKHIRLPDQYSDSVRLMIR